MKAYFVLWRFDTTSTMQDLQSDLVQIDDTINSKHTSLENSVLAFHKEIDLLFLKLRVLRFYV